MIRTAVVWDATWPPLLLALGRYLQARFQSPAQRCMIVHGNLRQVERYPVADQQMGLNNTHGRDSLVKQTAHCTSY